MRNVFLLSLLLLAAAPARAQRLEELEAALKEGKQELAAPKRVKRRRSLLTVRLPSWELAAAKEGGALAGAPIPLPPEDKEMAAAVFGDAVDLEVVRLVYTDIAVPAVPQTWGNVIRVPLGADMSRATLIHELTHVWQFQSWGMDYISDSVLHNGWSVVTTGKRKKAYEYELVEGKSFFDYTAEQQAEIVEDYYANERNQEDPLYAARIGELRSRKGMPQEFIPEMLERDAGLLPRSWTIQPIPGFEEPREPGGGVPQLELRFDTPW